VSKKVLPAAFTEPEKIWRFEEMHGKKGMLHATLPGLRTPYTMACPLAMRYITAIRNHWSVIVHYQDSQRLGHIQHRKRGKTNSVDAANLPTTFLSDLHGAIDLRVTYSLHPPTIKRL
jgi:hypothetical protein